MKILMYATGKPFTPPQTGGFKRFVELTRILIKNEECNVCSADSAEVLGKFATYRKYVIQKEVQSKFKILPPEGRLLLKNKLILKAIKRSNYDCVISFDVPPTIGLCLFKIKNIVLMVRKDMIGYEKSKIRHMTLAKKIKLAYMWVSESICLRKARGIIVQCEYDKQELIKRHKLLKSAIERKTVVQINNVNPSWVVESRINNKIKDNLFHVGFIGNFSNERKGHQYLLPAAMNLVKKYDDIVFDIVGDGRQLEEYRRKYQHERIIFHGRLNSPWKILMNCQLTIVPSVADSCPNTVLESLYYGIPVVGSDRGGIPEILNGCIGAIFDLSSRAIEKKLEYFYSHKEALENLKQCEEKRKKELTFDWGECIRKIIHEMCEEKR